ncbi:hypothetical protein M8C21_033797, partial [Ambrosia artemisiifolia]
VEQKKKRKKKAPANRKKGRHDKKWKKRTSFTKCLKKELDSLNPINIGYKEIQSDDDVDVYAYDKKARVQVSKNNLKSSLNDGKERE